MAETWVDAAAAHYSKRTGGLRRGEVWMQRGGGEKKRQETRRKAQLKPLQETDGGKRSGCTWTGALQFRGRRTQQRSPMAHLRGHWGDPQPARRVGCSAKRKGEEAEESKRRARLPSHTHTPTYAPRTPRTPLTYTSTQTHTVWGRASRASRNARLPPPPLNSPSPSHRRRRRLPRAFKKAHRVATQSHAHPHPYTTAKTKW